MKIGVLFWGFNDLDFISKCSKTIKEKHDIKEFYIQISHSEKTISLIDLFPEEIIRSESDDLSILYKWLAKNHKKNIIVTVNIWGLLSKKNFQEKLTQLKEILNEPFQFILSCPRNIHEPIFFEDNKKLTGLIEKNSDFFRNTADFFNLTLNCSSPIMILMHSPHISFLNSICSDDIFAIKKVGFFNVLPSILYDFSSIFVSTNNLTNCIENKIEYISKLIQNAKNKKDLDLLFNNEIVADFGNPNDKNDLNKKKIKGFLVSSSLEHVFHFKNKEESRFLSWLLFLGIYEKYYYQESKQNNSIEENSSLELFSSSFM
ncbi:hypothetical protein QEJ31_07525 [Pigmentibacter sp. JX0631]|uniref:hypothetical protein n=1 Tax=Pigmentibacter sp. JX0631 TaxID=2976982 RepID=UPI0024682EA4|nr:hypothetical protein [Pigmentibacter sp. JX0631]WGL61437.1 hypothetical protein QEJ31_07525 [Pigmentibacter sp. JX0631]